MAPKDAPGYGRRLVNSLIADQVGLLGKINQLVNFQVVQNFKPELTKEQALKVLGEEWKCAPETKILEIQEAKHAGSIAQVHHAILKEGSIKNVAIKVQYPGVKKSIRRYLKFIRKVPALGPMAKWNFPTEDYKDLLEDCLPAECDFNMELAANKIATSFENKRHRVIMPKSLSELSGMNVIVYEWIDANPLIVSAPSFDSATRVKLAEVLFKTFLAQVITDAYFQSDWNSGNILLTKNNEVVLVDFGSWIEMDRSESDSLKKILALQFDSNNQLKELFITLGFSKEHLDKMDENLIELVHAFLRPFSSDKLFSQLDLQNNDQMLADRFGDLRWWFRAAGSAKFLHLIRAWFGLQKHLEALNVSIPYKQWFEEELRMSVRAPIKSLEGNIPLISKKLHIQLTNQRGEALVYLEFPARSTEHLKELMGDDLYSKVKNQGIDPEKISREFINANGPVSVLLSTEIESKNIKIWTT